MTFYNLPDTDVTIEYDKNTKRLIIANLPDDNGVARGEYVDLQWVEYKNKAVISWGEG